METIKIFFLIYVMVVGLVYALMTRSGVPFLLPGDFLIIKASRRIYIPLGTSLIFTIILFVLLNFLRR